MTKLFQSSKTIWSVLKVLFDMVYQKAKRDTKKNFATFKYDFWVAFTEDVTSWEEVRKEFKINKSLEMWNGLCAIENSGNLKLCIRETHLKN